MSSLLSRAINLGLREQQRLSDGVRRLRGQDVQRIVFLHIPKCAGSTINAWMRHRLGTARSGRFVHLQDPSLEPDIAKRIEAARRARFVCGHFGRNLFDLVRDGAFAFTFLREPRARLRSHYLYFSDYSDPDWRITADDYLEFLTGQKREFVRARDNVITRMLAAAMEPEDVGGVPRGDWPARAEETLAGMDAIGFQHRFDADFAAIRSRLGLSHHRPAAALNVTRLSRPASAARKAELRIGAAELAAEDACLELDLALYDRWRPKAEAEGGRS